MRIRLAKATESSRSISCGSHCKTRPVDAYYLDHRCDVAINEPNERGTYPDRATGEFGLAGVRAPSPVRPTVLPDLPVLPSWRTSARADFPTLLYLRAYTRTHIHTRVVRHASSAQLFAATRRGASPPALCHPDSSAFGCRVFSNAYRCVLLFAVQSYSQACELPEYSAYVSTEADQSIHFQAFASLFHVSPS